LEEVQRTGCGTFSHLERMGKRGIKDLDRGRVERMPKSEPKRVRQCLASGGDKIDY